MNACRTVVVLGALVAPGAVRANAADDDVLPPRPDHVVVVIEENHAFNQVVYAPYIRSLARGGALFTSSFGIRHPSQPNYLDLFSGGDHGIHGDYCFTPISAPNLGGRLRDAGLSFAGFSESMPSDGWLGCSSGSYDRKHNPWSDFADLPAEVNLRFSRWPADFTALPTVAFVVPNERHNMHDGSVAAGDAWLRKNLDAYVQWATTHNSLLVVTWDEDDKGSGNHVATIFVGPMVAPGRYGGTINHFSVLRALLEMYGLAPVGGSGRAPSVGDVWTGPRITSAAGAVAAVGRPFEYGVTTDAAGPVEVSSASPLPPGLELSGAALAGTPTDEGTWIVDLYAEDATGRTGRRVALVVERDTDGDGFSDEIESALGTDPSSAASTPAAGAAAAPGGALAVTRFDARLRIAAPVRRDTITVRGALDVPAQFSAKDAAVTVDVAGVVSTFALRADGASRPDPARRGNSLHLGRPRRGSTTAAFRLRLAGDFGALLADEAMTSEPGASRRTAALVTFLVDGAVSEVVVPVYYSTNARGVGRGLR